MRKLLKIASKLISNHIKNRSKNDAKNWSKKDRRTSGNIGDQRLQKTKKIRNLRPWGRPIAIFGAGPAECADPAEALELGKIGSCDSARLCPETGAADLIEGGQRPVTAAPPFWFLAFWDLDGMTGRVYVRTVCRCNRWLAGSWQIPCRSLQFPNRNWYPKLRKSLKRRSKSIKNPKKWCPGALRKGPWKQGCKKAAARLRFWHAFY